MILRSEKWSPTRPSRRSEWNRVPVERDDAGGLLTAMLERMQAQRGDGGGIGMAENAEYAAFLAQAVGVHVEIEGAVGGRAGIGRDCHRAVQTLVSR